MEKPAQLKMFHAGFDAGVQVIPWNRSRDVVYSKLRRRARESGRYKQMTIRSQPFLVKS